MGAVRDKWVRSTGSLAGRQDWIFRFAELAVERPPLPKRGRGRPKKGEEVTTEAWCVSRNRRNERRAVAVLVDAYHRYEPRRFPLRRGDRGVFVFISCVFRNVLSVAARSPDAVEEAYYEWRDGQKRRRGNFPR